jgi:hypothetical protein
MILRNTLDQLWRRPSVKGQTVGEQNCIRWPPVLALVGVVDGRNALGGEYRIAALRVAKVPITINSCSKPGDRVARRRRRRVPEHGKPCPNPLPVPSSENNPGAAVSIPVRTSLELIPSVSTEMFQRRSWRQLRTQEIDPFAGSLDDRSIGSIHEHASRCKTRA